jgi:uncharacterized protein involved in exopolysaccharide biosynthesis
MHRGLAISVAVIVAALFLVYARTIRPQYKTESLIYVQPLMAKVVTDTSGGFYDANRYDSYIQQQLQTIVRPDILGDALDHLPPGTWSGPGESRQSAVARLQGALKVERLLGSYEVSISLTGGDPASITAVVNAVTRSYLQKGRLDELAQSDQQLQLLSGERVRLQQNLSEDEQEQDKLAAVLGVADPGGVDANPYDAQLQDMRKQLVVAQAARSFAEAQLASVSGATQQGASGLSAAAEDSAASDPGMAALKSSINQRRSVLISQMAGLTPKNPIYQQDSEELARLTNSMDTLVGDMQRKAAPQIQSKLRLDAARAAEVENGLQAQLQRLTAQAASASPKLQRASELALEIHRLQARFSEIDNAVHSVELEHNSSGLVHLVMSAAQPQHPEASKRALLMLVAFPVGALFGLVAAVLRHRTDGRVYTGTDLQSALGVPAMAVLPSTADVSPRVTDEFLLRLAAGIDQTQRQSGASTYLVAGASAKDDIAELVAALARKLNQLGYRAVILKVSEALEAAAAPDPELGPSRWTDTSLTRAEDRRAGGLKRTPFVADNLERLRHGADILLIEGYPLLYSAETEFVARLADATVLVARSGETTRKGLKSALALLRRLQARGVAVVLHDLALRDADEEFLAAVRSSEGRQSSIWQLKRGHSDPLRVTPELETFQGIEPVSQSERPVS